MIEQPWDGVLEAGRTGLLYMGEDCEVRARCSSQGARTRWVTIWKGIQGVQSPVGVKLTLGGAFTLGARRDRASCTTCAVGSRDGGRRGLRILQARRHAPCGLARACWPAARGEPSLPATGCRRRGDLIAACERWQDAPPSADPALPEAGVRVVHVCYFCCRELSIHPHTRPTAAAWPRAAPVEASRAAWNRRNRWDSLQQVAVHESAVPL